MTKNITIGILTFLLFVSVIGHYTNKNSVSILKDQDVIDALVNLMVLPDEEPTITEISTLSDTLSSQGFYKNVSEGDYLVLFAEARKAVIYRPSDNVIINVGPIVTE